MTDKDTKDMTASELLRWAALNENDCHANNTAHARLLSAVEGRDYYRSSDDADRDALRTIADKIDAELAQARELSLLRGAELWAMANGWPDFKDGEDFGVWLNRCALKLPCDKDGEPWHIDDRVCPSNTGETTVVGYIFDKETCYLKLRWCGEDGRANDLASMCKRPAPEALGADGKPIVEGETVWLDEAHSRCAGSYGFEDGNKYSLCGIERQEMLTVEDAHIEVDGREYVRVCTCGAWCHASWLTHTPPETQERIDDDATLSPREYYNAHIGHDVGLKDDEEVAVAMVHDLLRRQRELDKRTGGAE